MKFKYLEDIATADVAMQAFGKTIEEAFKNSALGMYNIITDLKKVKPVIKKTIEIKSSSLKSLLYDWLEYLLIYFDTEGLIFSSYNITVKKDKGHFLINGEILGEIFDKRKHSIKGEVKAVTYHQMKITKEKGKYIIQIIFDL